MLRAALLALLLAAPLAGCLAADPPAPSAPPAPPPPARVDAGDPRDGLLFAYLRDGYPRADAVDWDAVRITGRREIMVGDVPVLALSAAIDRDGKEAQAFFDARDGRFVSAHWPDYREVTRGKLGYDVVREMRGEGGFEFEPPAPNGTLEVSVYFFRLPEPATRDDGNETGRILAYLEVVRDQISALAGVESVALPEAPSHPRLVLRGDAAAVRAVAERDDVEAIDLNNVVRLSTGAFG